MLNSVLLFLARFAVGKKLIAGVDGVNERLTGHRTEILIALEALIYLLQKIGLLSGIDPELIAGIKTALLGAIPITMAEKVKKAQDTVDKVIVK